VRWREACAKSPPRRFQSMDYWAKPLAGFGDPHARVLIVGLAPAANGGNRTGRMFTGDRWRLALRRAARLWLRQSSEFEFRKEVKSAVSF